ncbi:MAG TPA: pyridoxamine 5'-phosphate oxidase family protein [Thermoanaerobaculia bacterium]|nr:pyridoxamine 5'-phosphate oxidase family protein [Thermoanaerobaculia bacterium]
MPGYGIPKSRKGLLPWSHVDARMSAAMRYWVATADPEGHPHATPVDGLWLEGRLYFGGFPSTRRSRNLLANPAACVHLEEAMDVVILHGYAAELRDPERGLIERLAELSKQKYGWSPPPEQFAAGGVFVFQPRLVLAWKDFPKDATRWRVDEDD